MPFLKYSVFSVNKKYANFVFDCKLEIFSFQLNMLDLFLLLIFKLMFCLFPTEIPADRTAEG